MGRPVTRAFGWLVVTPALVLASAAHATECADAEGLWTDNYNWPWGIDQIGPNVAGTVVTRCGTCAVTGISNGGRVDLLAICNNPPPDEVCAANFTYSGYLFKPGCQRAAGTWLNSAGLTGQWSMTHSCRVPTTETTQSDGWLSGGVTHRFKMTLQPTSYNFGGRTVSESSNGDGIDTCYRSGDNTIEQTDVRFFDAEVNASSQYADVLGWSADAIRYYRQRGRAPCQFSVTQFLSIGCEQASPVYKAHEVAMGIKPFHVWVSRDGVNPGDRYWNPIGPIN